MRVYFTFPRITLVLAVLWMAMGIPAVTFAMEPGSDSPRVVIAEPTVPANFTEYYEMADTKPRTQTHPRRKPLQACR